MISSNIIRELKQQYSEGPEEITVQLFLAAVTSICCMEFNFSNISYPLKFGFIYVLILDSLNCSWCWQTKRSGVRITVQNSSSGLA